MILREIKRRKNIYYLDGCSLKTESSMREKTKTSKRVQFSESVEICGDLGKGGFVDNYPNPTLLRFASGMGKPYYK